MIKETLSIETRRRTPSEIDRIVSRGISALRCPTHGSAVTYDPATVDAAAGKPVVQLDVICCCNELLVMARNAATR